VDDYWRYDYARLEATAQTYKDLYRHETVVRLSAENHIPLQVVVSTLDALRGSDCKLSEVPPGETPPGDCLFWRPLIEAGVG
jgi:hypothetical protein